MPPHFRLTHDRSDKMPAAEKAEKDDVVANILNAKRAAATSMIPEMRSLLLAQKETSKAYLCTDSTLARFLESNVMHKGTTIKNVKVSDAAKQLVGTLKWRADNGLETTPPIRDTHCCEGCETHAFGHCFFSCGVDRRGWEVVYACPGRSGLKEVNGLVRHMILILESIFSGPFEEDDAAADSPAPGATPIAASSASASSSAMLRRSGAV